MTLLVQKFGGTSVGNLERIAHVADIIIKTREQGHQVVVVVSAMSGETDRLINLAKAVNPDPNPREYASMISTGEQVSMALLAILLCAKGYNARSFTGLQAKIKTDNQYKHARILSIDNGPLKKFLDQGGIPVVAGFQGYSEEGDITTLGRGGSDTTAVALSTSLKADECQIFTDVEGVYTADQELSHKHVFLIILLSMKCRARQFRCRSIEIRFGRICSKYNVPLRVLSSFKPGAGTLLVMRKK